ncbi:DUF664 domain-containing protein [Kribbella sp. CA-253562]|uniref:mycothiol transferase n=1 Tax=Kribbella sp. CA-253562 TaxID=3239942 RepID=UPI003D8A50AB
MSDDTNLDECPWEPPLAGSEVEHLLGALDRLRTTFRFKADGLGPESLNQRIGASALTLGGLLKHLALQEDYTVRVKFQGGDLGTPWQELGWDGSGTWEFETAAQDSPEQLYAWYDDSVARSRRLVAEALADGGLGQDAHVAWPDGTHASLRRLLFDLVEEYGRHTGHADLLREAVDGVTGEDPPIDWRPASGTYTFS